VTRWRAVAALGLAAMAIGVAGAGWWDDVPELTADDAVVATEQALRDAGLDATVEHDPVAHAVVDHGTTPRKEHR
jgi:hypothetical protein